MTSSSLFAQKPKKDYYFDAENNPISKVDFDNRDYNFYSIEVTENDTAYFGRFTYKKVYDRFSKTDLNQFYNVLRLTTNSMIDTTSTYIIGYYGKYTSCLEGDLNRKNYKRKIKKKENIKQIFIIGKDQKFISLVSKIYSDKLNFFKRYFIQQGNNCANYVIVKPDGMVFKLLGEFWYQDIIDYAIEDWFLPSVILKKK